MLIPQSHFMPLHQIDAIIVLFRAAHPQSWQILQEQYHPHWILGWAALSSPTIQEIFGNMQHSFPLACTTVAPLDWGGTYLLMGCTSPQVLPQHRCHWSLPSLQQSYCTCSSWHTWWPHPSMQSVVFPSLPCLPPQTPHNAAIIDTWLLHLWRVLMRLFHPSLLTTIPSH